MRYCKDCELYECCMRSPLGGCQELDNVAPKPIEPIATKEAWKHLYEQLDWDWEKFRREAAKDIVCAILSAGMEQTNDKNEHFHSFEELARVSVKWADELIKTLKEDKK